MVADVLAIYSRLAGVLMHLQLDGKMLSLPLTCLIMCNDFMRTQKRCRRSIITLAPVQTEEQEILRERLKNLEMGMLGNISRYDGKVGVWKAYLNVPIQDCFLELCPEVSL